MSTGNNPKIVLVAEDEPDLADVIQEVLTERLGYRVIMVDSSKDAVRKLDELREAKTPPDLLITDYGLTDGKTGIDLIAAARQQQPTLPTILVTGSQLDIVGKALSEKAVNASSIVTLGKPFKLSALLDAAESGASKAAEHRASIRSAGGGFATVTDRLNARPERNWQH
jgi:CheY-like chemotaxis protein